MLNSEVYVSESSKIEGCLVGSAKADVHEPKSSQVKGLSDVRWSQRGTPKNGWFPFRLLVSR